MATEISKDDIAAEGGRTRTSRFSAFYTLQRYRDFRLLWVGNFFSSGAQWVQILTIGWLVLKLTDGNALLTGTVVGVRTFPVLLIGPWAGVLADRVDRRKLLMATQGVMATAAVAFAFLVIVSDLDSDTPSGPLRWWHPYIYMAVSGVAQSIIMPVRISMVANTVPRAYLVNAIALNGMAFTSTRIFGPALGGLVIATLGFKWNFFLEAVGYLGVILLLIPVRLPYRDVTGQQSSSILTSMKDGLGYVRHETRILQLIVMSLIPNFVFQPLVFVLPVFTSEVLGRDAGVGGILISAIGVGGISAAVIIATVGYVFRKGMTTFVGLIGACVFVLLFAQSHWLILSMALLGGLGFCQYIFRVGNATLLQIIVPDALRGRVMSIYLLDHGLIPLATLLISLLIHVWNPADAFTVIAGVALFLAILQALTFRRARQLE